VAVGRVIGRAVATGVATGAALMELILSRVAWSKVGSIGWEASSSLELIGSLGLVWRISAVTQMMAAIKVAIKINIISFLFMSLILQVISFADN
jgi:hypothetical protein